MCDLKKALDFVKSCVLKENDGRRYLENVVYDKEKSAIVGTDGRRLAVLVVDPERITGAANLAERFNAVAFDESKQKFTVYPFAESVKFPEGYLQVIPRGLDHYTGANYDATEDDKTEYMFTWSNYAGASSYNYEKEELPAGLCVELARRFLDYKPKYLKLPVYKETTNEWAVLGDGHGVDPVVFFNHYQYAGMWFKMIYVVMPMRGDDTIGNYMDAKDILDNAFLNANVADDRWRVVAGHDPAMLEKFMNVMFRKPGDPLFYLAESFRGATWYDVKTKVEKWARGEK